MEGWGGENGRHIHIIPDPVNISHIFEFALCRDRQRIRRASRKKARIRRARRAYVRREVGESERESKRVLSSPAKMNATAVIFHMRSMRAKWDMFPYSSGKRGLVIGFEHCFERVVGVIAVLG